MIEFSKQILLRLRNDKRGVTIIEYALLAGLIGVALVGTLTTLKSSIVAVFTAISTSV